MPYLRTMFTRLARDRSPDPAKTRNVTFARRFWLALILAVATVAIIVLLIWPGWAYQWSWTGFGPSTGFPEFQRISIAHPAKTLWDWLQLMSALLVPIAVAAAGLWFTHQQTQTENEIAESRQREDALQTYIDRVSELLMEKQLGTDKSPPEARLVAQVRTTTTLGQLDRRRRNVVLRFLTTAGLINRAELQDGPVESLLSGANLRWIDLSEALLARADLQRADLTGTDLRAANLGGANLIEAHLSQAILREADLREADLGGAVVQRAELRGADLHRANLVAANLLAANLGEADLHGAVLRGAVLYEANLRQANLSDADLRGANLYKADLREAKLGGATLHGANLTGADLSGAVVTGEQLNTAVSLAGATLRDSTKLPDDFKGRLPHDEPPRPSGAPSTPPPAPPAPPSTQRDMSQAP
jgi:uncharacterized protein YjbI with pentapeptide repeats